MGVLCLFLPKPRLQFTASGTGRKRQGTDNDAADQSSLVVLCVQVHRIPRHLLLRGAKEEQPDLFPPRVPSRLHADPPMVSVEIRARGIVLFRAPAQLLHPLHHVCVLYVVRVWSSHAEVFVVEEVLDEDADVPVHLGVLLLFQFGFRHQGHGVRVRLVPLDLRHYTILAFPTFLPAGVHREESCCREGEVVGNVER